MSFDKDGVFQGHTPDDDAYEHGFKVGARVENTHGWTGEIVNSLWQVRWDDPGLDDELHYTEDTSDLKVIEP